MTRFPLLWLLAGLLAGTGAAVHGVPALPLAGGALCGYALLAVARRATLVATLLPGLAAGALAVALQPPPVLPPDLALRRQFSGCVRVDRQAGEQRLGVTLYHAGAAVPLLLATPDSYTANPGDLLQVAGEAWVPDGALYDGGFDYRALLAGRGYAGVARARTWRVAASAGASWRGTLWQWRRDCRAAVRRSLGTHGGWATAFLFGEQNDLQPDEQQVLQVAGLGHILAVSGLNVGIVAWLAAGLGFFLPRYARLLWLGLAVTAYALLVGEQSAVVRATLMLLAALLPPLFSRPVIGIHCLMLAACAALLAAPHALREAGFQLSFAVTFAMLWLHANHPRVAASWWGAGAMALVAQAAALPLMLHWFNFISPAAFPVNLLLLPTFTWLVVWALLALVPFPPLATVAAQLFGLQVDGVQAVAAAGEGLLPHRNVPPLTPLWSGACYLCLLLLLWQGSPRAVRRWCGLLLAVLFAVPFLTAAPPVIDILAVRLGDATLLHGAQADLLVDAGPPEAARDLLAQLRLRGVNRLATVIITHPHADHYGGLPLLLAELPVGELWYRDWDGDSGAAACAALLAASGVRLQQVQAPRHLDWDGGTVAVNAPADGEVNDRSLVCRVSWRGRALLLAGDLEEEGTAALLATGADLRAAVLKLPHHGAENDRLGALLDAVQPEAAVSSAPAKNRFGFPHPATRRALRARGIAAWQTGVQGRYTLAPRGRN